MKSLSITSALTLGLKTFKPHEKVRLFLILAAQCLSSLLDLAGVALIGIIGAVSISGVASQKPGNRVYQALSVLGMENLSMQYQVVLLSVGAVCVLLFKTVLSMQLTKQSLLLMSKKSAEVTTDLFARKLSQNLLEVQVLSSQQTLYSVTNSVVALVVGVLGSIVTMISDFFLALILVIALFLVDPLTALVSTILFASIGVLSFLILGKKSQDLGASTSKLEVESNILILQALEAYRETIIGSKQNFYVETLGKIRRENALVIATAGFLPHISKYVIEAGLVCGAFLLSAIQFYINDAFQAVATLTIFLAAGSRVAPAILRIQQSSMAARNSLGIAEPCIEMLSQAPTVDNGIQPQESDLLFSPRVCLRNVQFTYPGNNFPTLAGIDLDIAEGMFVAIVGPSGGGKSTLVDIMLGVLTPQLGEARLSGIDPLAAHKIWPGRTAYVPQQITVFDVSVAENVALGVAKKDIDIDRVMECLGKAQILDFMSKAPFDLDVSLGEKGNKLSGGQRQRIGIARALYSDPRLIILDEATSALDVETEKAISDSIRTLREGRTIIVVAHRLSTIKEAEMICYVDQGKIVAQGDVNDLRRLIPAFERQALLSGL